MRPPIAQERLEQRPDGLVRIILRKAYSDGTVAPYWKSQVLRRKALGDRGSHGNGAEEVA